MLFWHRARWQDLEWDSACELGTWPGPSILGGGPSCSGRPFRGRIWGAQLHKRPPGARIPIPKDCQVPPGCRKKQRESSLKRWRCLEQGTGQAFDSGVKGPGPHLPCSALHAAQETSSPPQRDSAPWVARLPSGGQVFEGRSPLYCHSAARPGTEWTFKTCLLNQWPDG